jgi:peptide/nickel transport system substrate-binding protein
VPSGYDEGWFLNVNPETAHPRHAGCERTQGDRAGHGPLYHCQRPARSGGKPGQCHLLGCTEPYGNPASSLIRTIPRKPARLLDEAGWVDSNGDGTRDKDGVELVLRYITNDRELRKNVQAVVQQQWSLVGIGAELQNHSSDVYWNSYNDNGPQAQGLYDIAQYSSVGSSPIPEPPQLAVQ